MIYVSNISIHVKIAISVVAIVNLIMNSKYPQITQFTIIHDFMYGVGQSLVVDLVIFSCFKLVPNAFIKLFCL